MAERAPREGVVVLALPRSGTTLLQRIFDAHPDVACPPETHLLRAGARFLEDEVVAEGLHVGVRSGLAFAGFEAADVVARTRELVFGFMREHAQRRGRRVWAEKTPFNAFHLDAIEDLCGDAVRYVVLLRHPLDVVVSMQELFARSQRFPDEVHRYIRNEPNLGVALAQAWADITTRLLDFAERRAADTVVVRYEALVAQPEVEAARLFDALGLAPAPDAVRGAFAENAPVGFGDWKLLERVQVDQRSVGRYTQLSKHTISQLGGVVNAVATAAGYPALKQVAERTAEDALRQLELGQMLTASRARSGE